MENVLTARKLIYSIRERLNIYSDDSKVSDEYILFEIDDARKLLLKQYLSNLKKPVPLQALSVICIPVEEDKECFGGLPGILLKSKYKIPATLEATGRSNIHKLMMNNMLVKNLNTVDFERLPYLADSEFNHNQIYGTMTPDGYYMLYNKSNKLIFVDSIKLSIVAENPEEAWEYRCNKNIECSEKQNEFSNGECDDCDYLDSEYPLPGELSYQLRDLVTNTILTRYRIPIDNENNGSDDTLPESLILGGYGRRTVQAPNQE